MTEWNGVERRAQDHTSPVIICKQEKEIKDMSLGITEIKGDVKLLNNRINGSMEKIASHMQEGEGYRRLLITTAVSLVLAIIGGAVTAGSICYNLGQYTQQIAVNTKRLEVIELNERTRTSMRLDKVENHNI